MVLIGDVADCLGRIFALSSNTVCPLRKLYRAVLLVRQHGQRISNFEICDSGTVATESHSRIRNRVRVAGDFSVSQHNFSSLAWDGS